MTDSPWYQGIMLLVLIGAFIGLWVWAWSHKHKERFHDASMLPLEEDDGTIPGNEDRKD